MNLQTIQSDKVLQSAVRLSSLIFKPMFKKKCRSFSVSDL